MYKIIKIDQEHKTFTSNKLHTVMKFERAHYIHVSYNNHRIRKIKTIIIAARIYTHLTVLRFFFNYLMCAKMR